MIGGLDMNRNAVVNLKNPVNPGDVANKKYADASHLTVSGHQPNPFKYLMDNVRVFDRAQYRG